MPKSLVKLDEPAVSEFLDAIIDREHVHLLSCNPNAKTKNAMRGFVTASIDDALDWVWREQDAGRNIYFALNAPSNTQHKKAKKEEVKWIYGAHVDIDLPKGMDRNSAKAEDFIADAVERVQLSADLIGGRPHIIMSGNGVQALWMLEKPLKATDQTMADIERINRGLIAYFKAPTGTHNVERVLRVPGTVNFPDALKIERKCKPRLATLVALSRHDFMLSDFDKLPKPKFDVRKSAKYTDYTATPYHTLEPYSFDSWCRFDPTIKQDALARYNDPDRKHDRSAAMWPIINSALRFLWTQERCVAEDFLDDTDIKHNIMDLVLDSGDEWPELDEILSCYDDHQYGLGKLGYDIQQAINAAAQDGQGWTPRGEAKAVRRLANIETNTKPLPDVEPYEARKAFIDYCRESMPDIMNDLPNVVMASADKTAIRQLATESNVREILRVAEIEARYNAMLDEVRYVVSKDAGKGRRDPVRPAENWAIALGGSHADMRAHAEQSLILDAVAQFGITSRSDLPPLLKTIAKEKRYHPIEHYCKAVPWDGVKRIGQVADCLNSAHPLKQRYIEIFFYQCVAAVLSLRKYMVGQLGEQLSSVVVLTGPQGIGKTTFWEMVTPVGFMSKGQTLKIGANREEDAKRECLSGLVCNMDEIGASLNKSEAEALKNFLAAVFDEFRVAYSPLPVSKPRMTVFVGTSNELILHDQTGSRRFLALPVDSIDLDRLANIDLQQVFAEAWQAVVVEGANWWLSKGEDKTRAEHNEDNRAVSEEESVLTSYLADVGKNHDYEWATATQICKLLDLRYSPARWPIMRRILDANGVEYREKQKLKRKVYGFPVLPQRWAELKSASR